MNMADIKDKEIDNGLELLAQLDMLDMLDGKSRPQQSLSSGNAASGKSVSGNAAMPATQTKKVKKRGVMWVLGGGILQDKNSLKQLPLVLLILVFGILLVSNRYYVEDLSRDKLATEERISFLKEHKIEMQKEYQETIKISAIAKELDTVGVGLQSGAPLGI